VKDHGLTVAQWPPTKSKEQNEGTIYD